MNVRCIRTGKKLQILSLKVINVSSSHESKDIVVVPSISRERKKKYRAFSYRFRSHPLQGNPLFIPFIPSQIHTSA
ncbi:hypothetical protein EYC84_005613 [Monilinia fructicola]|uniref:Uncharacterized protein n=1 Tax=Monilinia fructicola TaxID=38448 RepID=A0A5M9K0X4_MONFR|nr:hypothetical protein EYC84_005613 [Monilinia fructicola]